MKKYISVLLISVIFSVSVFSQNSAAAANKNTALRCLKNAESCLYAKDFQNALSQAKLGLSYDDSISDLLYVQSAAMLNLSYNINEVLPVIKSAFEKNNWSGYSKTGARILFADLLSESGDYSQSLEVLDGDDAIFSADAEFIRIKNFYRMGTLESLNSARQRVSSARRVFPADGRFPKIFFMFEHAFMSRSERENYKYSLPSIVNSIASSYIISLPDYSGGDSETELLAAFFASGEEQKRLVKAIDAKNQISSPLLAVLGLKTGLYSASDAFERFFAASGDSVSLENLLDLCILLNDDESIFLMTEKLTNYNGILTADFDCNLINEIEIKYQTGRPYEIRYDKNNDGVNEYFSICDFGLPSLLYMEGSKTQIFYSAYPAVSKISFSDTDFSFNFLDRNYELSPFDFSIEPIFSKFGVNFYIPYIFEDFSLPEIQSLVKNAASVEFPVLERENSRVVFTSDDGNLVFARYYEDDFNYAYCDFSKGLPFIRYADYDNDGFFETTEYYDSVFDEYGERIFTDDNSYIKNIFGDAFSDSVYLRKVAIDANANTFSEFSEQYLNKNGKITLWDNDDNGIPDCQYIRYPLEDDGNVREDAIFFNSNGMELVTVQSINSVPVKCIYEGSEVLVLAGTNENFYWLDKKGTEESENIVKKNFPNGLEQGQVQLLQSEDYRFSVVRVAGNYFCMIKPDSDIAEDSENSSAENSEN